MAGVQRLCADARVAGRAGAECGRTPGARCVPAPTPPLPRSTATFRLGLLAREERTSPHAAHWQPLCIFLRSTCLLCEHVDASQSASFETRSLSNFPYAFSSTSPFLVLTFRV